MIRIALAIAIAVLLAAAPAHAAVCSITAVTPVAFGSYNVFASSALLSAGSITYECTGVGASDTVILEISGTADAGTLRAMTSGAVELLYQLYVDASRTAVWGTGTGGTSVYGPTHPTDGTPTAVPVYGKVPAHQDVSAGAYSDSLLVTLQL
jgi:spore coat protein U domain-containing protein, fimbrial subunit CupE1/2/3/6